MYKKENTKEAREEEEQENFNTKRILTKSLGQVFKAN